MKILKVVSVAFLAGSFIAKLGLSFAPAVFTTYAGTAIVSAVMAISGWAAIKLAA